MKFTTDVLSRKSTFGEQLTLQPMTTILTAPGHGIRTLVEAGSLAT